MAGVRLVVVELPLDRTAAQAAVRVDPADERLAGALWMTPVAANEPVSDSVPPTTIGSLGCLACRSLLDAAGDAGEAEHEQENGRGDRSFR